MSKILNNIRHAIAYYFKSIDLPLFATTVALCLFSILNLYGIVGWDGNYVEKQVIVVLVAILVMIVASFFNYRYLKNYSLPVMIFYILVIGLLLLTLLSPSVRGINAWVEIAGLKFEPSELAKITIIVLLAKYFSQRHIHINQFRHVLVSGIYFAIPTLIILIQPDLGSAAILGLIWFGILMAAGINRKQFILIVASGLILSMVAWMFVLKPYQKDRILAFINPYQDPTGFGYNIIQSKIAVGAGYLIGNGLGNGSQARLGFLPEAHNDFAFAAMTEQFGVIGVLSLFSVFTFIFYRIIAIGERTENNFGKLFCLGMIIFIFAHSAISASVNIGLMPITGIPFPFISYGGSNLVSVMLGLGIIQSIKRHG